MSGEEPGVRRARCTRGYLSRVPGRPPPGSPRAAPSWPRATRLLYSDFESQQAGRFMADSQVKRPVHGPELLD
jgi:hypothetical protein